MNTFLTVFPFLHERFIKKFYMTLMSDFIESGLIHDQPTSSSTSAAVTASKASAPALSWSTAWKKQRYS